MSLAESHLAMIRASAISEEVAQRRGYRSVTEIPELELLGFSPAQRRVPGLLVPIRNIAGEVVLHTYRPDSPREQKRDGKVRILKYEFPAGCRMHLDIPAGTAEAVRDITRRLWIVEGSKKADALVSVGEVVVGLAGVWNWRGSTATGGKATLPDWDSVPVNGREVVVGFDSDLATNRSVAQAADRLAAWLASRGARVTIARIPHGPDGAKVGIDDFLAAGGKLADLPLHPAGVLTTATRKEPPDSVAGVLDHSDLANARRLVAVHGENIRHAHGLGWMVFQDGHWQQDTTGTVLRYAEDVVQRIAAEAIKNLRAPTAEDDIRHALRSAARNRIEAMAALAEHHADVAVGPDIFDTHPTLFGCANGVLDLETGELHPHDRGLYLTKQTSVAYDPAAMAPRWEKFLAEVLPDPDVREFVRRLCGYGMTALVKEHILPIFWGGGRNGKGTLFEALAHVMGPYYEPVDARLLISSGSNLGPEKMKLRGIRLGTISETRKDGRLNAEAAKTMTGGDRITARDHYQAPVTFAPTWKIIVATNFRPVVDDTSVAIWSRLRLVPFVVSFAGREDLTLGAALQAEAPGILRWLARAARDYLHGGLATPAAVLAATNDYRSEQDLVGVWIEEHCATGRTYYRTSAQRLYESFTRFCTEQGEEVPTQRAFGDALRGRGFGKAKASTKFWTGITLAADAPTDPAAELARLRAQAAELADRCRALEEESRGTVRDSGTFPRGTSLSESLAYGTSSEECPKVPKGPSHEILNGHPHPADPEDDLEREAIRLDGAP